ncbi:hypothetical protein KSP40_PGU002141 [Platanthera guangdongensis]|uniref:Chlorophyll a-b binding protein, chloroplastic n=1 Tax=Platanthera guangdongensis TaxID=2320717 RepID=A0ABR2LSB4_9ASPA
MENRNILSGNMLVVHNTEKELLEKHKNILERRMDTCAQVLDDHLLKVKNHVTLGIDHLDGQLTNTSTTLTQNIYEEVKKGEKGVIKYNTEDVIWTTNVFRGSMGLELLSYENIKTALIPENLYGGQYINQYDGQYYDQNAKQYDTQVDAYDFGLDPLRLGEVPENLERFKESELIHCRWAMLAVPGVLIPEALGLGNWVKTQEWATIPGGQATYLAHKVAPCWAPGLCDAGPGGRPGETPGSASVTLSHGETFPPS